MKTGLTGEENLSNFILRVAVQNNQDLLNMQVRHESQIVKMTFQFTRENYNWIVDEWRMKWDYMEPTQVSYTVDPKYAHWIGSINGTYIRW